MENTTQTKIADMHDAEAAKAEALRRWQVGNLKGEGRAWDGFPLLRAADDDEVDLYMMRDGSEVAVGMANGPWAVTVTPAPKCPAAQPDDAFDAWLKARWPQGIATSRRRTGDWINIALGDLRNAFEAGREIARTEGR